MGKPSKIKKNKVPKITEAEYAAYLTTLKASESAGKQTTAPLSVTKKNDG